jgi:hypothetical protein
MAVVRQLPELYLRGSLATITMAGLTDKEREEAQALTLDIAFSSEMASHRIGMINELKNTISADYKDESVGESEYIIAIFRGVVDILHHHRYSFCCTACGQTTYTTKQGRIKQIDRMQAPCPNCRCVRVTKPGDTDLKADQILTIEQFQKSYEHHTDIAGLICGEPIVKLAIQHGQEATMEIDKDKTCKIKANCLLLPPEVTVLMLGHIQEARRKGLTVTFKDDMITLSGQHAAPEMTTTIVPIKGEKKYPDPYAILNDPIQKKKLFGEYVWNYFRQHINENERKTHSKVMQTITGTAGIVFGESIAAFLELHKVHHTFSLDEKHGQKVCSIAVRCLELPPEITIEIVGIIQEARSKNAKVTFTSTEIMLTGGDSSTTEKSRKERVAVLESTARIESDVDTLDSVGHRTVGGARVNQDDHEQNVDLSDALLNVKSVLQDGVQQSVLMILSQQGEIYKRFSDRYGDGQAKQNHMAEFLGVPTKTISTTMDKIKVLCIAKGLTP